MNSELSMRQRSTRVKRFQNGPKLDEGPLFVGKGILSGIVLAVLMFTSLGVALGAGPEPIDLGSTAPFAILAGATITSTGGGSINGDVGASPITGAAIGVTVEQVNGTIYAVDAAGPAGSVIDPARLLAAKGDMTTAYNEARDRTPVPVGDFLNPGSGNIGGMNLIPGLYKFTGTASITGSDVTLTGGPDDVWIFQVASDLQVGSTIQVILAGGAQARNIFWQVGTSATLGTFSVFKGTIIADQAITMDTSSSIEGRCLAFTAGITYNASSGSLPLLKAPVFTDISMITTNVEVMVVATTPYFPLTIERCADLVLADWEAIHTNTPVTSSWIFTNDVVDPVATQLFYRAFITAYTDVP